jgi:hypothetical protein
MRILILVRSRLDVYFMGDVKYPIVDFDAIHLVWMCSGKAKGKFELIYSTVSASLIQLLLE